MNVPTLTVTDLGNNAGATAAVVGSSVGSTNTVQTMPVFWGSTAWTAQGSVTGDGSVSLTLSAGYYWASVLSSLSGQQTVSTVVQFAVTSNADAVHKRCLDAALSRLQSMKFVDPVSQSGILPPTHIYPQMVLSAENLAMPAIVVLAPQQAVQEGGGTNVRDDIKYPVAVFIIDKNAKQNPAPLPKYLKWREQISRAFRHQKVPTVPEIWNCKVQDEHIIDASAPIYQHIDCSMVLWFWSRELRGIE